MNALFPVVILAGGLATRLRPLTETIPKSLIDINGDPFIYHQLRLLKQHHIERVTICAGYLGEQIVDKVGDGSQFGLEITYAFDGPKLLGTAGAIKQALDLLGEYFFVLYGDSYLPCPYKTIQEAFLSQKQPALMTVFRNLGKWDSSNVEFTDNTILVYDKKHKTVRMHYIDYGLGVFHRSAFDQLPAEESYDLALLYQELLAKKQLAAFEVKERFYEIGSFMGINELEAHLTTDVTTA